MRKVFLLQPFETKRDAFGSTYYQTCSREDADYFGLVRHDDNKLECVGYTENHFFADLLQLVLDYDELLPWGDEPAELKRGAA